MNTEIRPICLNCNIRLLAINYIRDGKIHYRSKCLQCLKDIKVKPSVTRWQQAGYQKKLKCDRCGHTSRHHQIFVVYYKDNKMTNVNRNNLQTVCLNCNIELSLGLPWADNRITADF